MKREELVTQIAKAVAAARDDEVTVELVSDIRWASYLGFANAIVTHLDSLGMVVVEKPKPIKIERLKPSYFPDPED